MAPTSSEPFFPSTGVSQQQSMKWWMVAGVLRENNACAHIRARVLMTEPCRRVSLSLPRVIADSDVRMLAAITALNAQEIKCSTEVIRRVNPRAPRYCGWVEKMIFHITSGKKESTYADVYYWVVCALFNTLWCRLLLSESVHLRNVCSNKLNAGYFMSQNEIKFA